MNEAGAVSALQLWGLWRREGGFDQRSTHADEAADVVSCSRVADPTLGAVIEQQQLHDMSTLVDAWVMDRQAPALFVLEQRYVHRQDFEDIAVQRIELGLGALQREHWPKQLTGKTMWAVERFEFACRYTADAQAMRDSYATLLKNQTHGVRRMHRSVVKGMALDFNRERAAKAADVKRAVRDPAMYRAMLGQALRRQAATA